MTAFVTIADVFGLYDRVMDKETVAVAVAAAAAAPPTGHRIIVDTEDNRVVHKV